MKVCTLLASILALNVALGHSLASAQSNSCYDLFREIPLFHRFVDHRQTETVIFVNGNGDTLDSFSYVQSLLPKTFNYLSYDQRGQGQSTYEGIDFKIDHMVEDLRRLTLANGLKKVHLVGHSFGGRIAMAYAAAYPSEVRSVVIEDMDLLAREPGGEAAVDHYARSFLALNRTYPSIEAMVQAIESVYGSDPSVLNEVLTKSLFQYDTGTTVTLLSTPYPPFLWGMYANVVDLGSAFQSYPGPVLFLRADVQLTALTNAGLQQILSLRPETPIVSFPGHPHGIHQFAPKTFAEIVTKFLQAQYTETSR